MTHLGHSQAEAVEELAADQREQQAVLRYSMNQARIVARGPTESSSPFGT